VAEGVAPHDRGVAAAAAAAAVVVVVVIVITQQRSPATAHAVRLAQVPWRQHAQNARQQFVGQHIGRHFKTGYCALTKL